MQEKMSKTKPPQFPVITKEEIKFVQSKFKYGFTVIAGRCEYCSTIVKKDKNNNCPNCGAPINEKNILSKMGLKHYDYDNK